MKKFKNVLWGVTREEINFSRWMIIASVLLGLVYIKFVDRTIINVFTTIFACVVTYVILRSIIWGIGRKPKDYKSATLKNLKDDLAGKKIFQYFNIVQKILYIFGLFLFIVGFFAVIISMEKYWLTHPDWMNTIVENLLNEDKFYAKLSNYGTWLTISGFGFGLWQWMETIIINGIKDRISELEKKTKDKSKKKRIRGIRRR